MSDSERIIGPALPPGFRKSSNEDSDVEVLFAGPALPPGYKQRDDSSSSEDSDKEEVVFKRRRPSEADGSTVNKQHKVEESQERSDDEDDGFFGPALPPGYQKRRTSPERPVLGPALPPGFHRVSSHDNEDGDTDDGDQGFAGPALPPGYKPEASSSDEEDEVIVGPMPAQSGLRSTVAMEFERRAERMKQKLLGGDSNPQELSRETWMTELPPELQHVGLEARTFKKRSGPENKDRSVWTDTPADRERKAREKLEAKERGELQKEQPCLSQKELQMADKVAKYNETKRGESLMSMHSKKMKKQAETEANKPVERRPFDRDADLQVNRFDEAQKRSLLKKSQELNTRFSHSKDRMFL